MPYKAGASLSLPDNKFANSSNTALLKQLPTCKLCSLHVREEIRVGITASPILAPTVSRSD